jgi:predicted ATP-dependent serine protease
MEKDEYVCKRCRMSTVGDDGFCINCGFDNHQEYDSEKESEDEIDEYSEKSEEDFYSEMPEEPEDYE